MTKTKLINCFLFLFFIGFNSCNTTENSDNQISVQKTEIKIVNVTHHDGRPFSTGQSTSIAAAKYVANPGGGVMMQAFYWDVPSGGNWWNTVKSKITDWGNAGIGSIYDSVKDAFYAPQPYPSWALSADFIWEAPTPMPLDDKRYAWDEATFSWIIDNR